MSFVSMEHVAMLQTAGHVHRLPSAAEGAVPVLAETTTRFLASEGVPMAIFIPVVLVLLLIIVCLAMAVCSGLRHNDEILNRDEAGKAPAPICELPDARSIDAASAEHAAEVSSLRSEVEAKSAAVSRLERQLAETQATLSSLRLQNDNLMGSTSEPLPAVRENQSSPKNASTRTIVQKPAEKGEMPVAPVLDVKQKAQVEDILKKTKVSVCAIISSCTPIDFQKMKHQADVSTAAFTDPEAVEKMLTGVAELLTVYDTACLSIQGHSSTPEDKMDAWADSLTLARAEKVKEVICRHGVQPERMETIGLPGSKGSNRTEVVMRITSF